MKLSFHRPTSRILIAGTLCLVFLLGTVLGWANTHLLSADSRFEQFTEELFQKEVSGNMLNLHYSLALSGKERDTTPQSYTWYNFSAFFTINKHIFCLPFQYLL